VSLRPVTYRRSALGLVGLVLLGRAGAAQVPGGAEGRITDPVGRPLVQAEVVLERPGGGTPLRAITNAEGAWRVVPLDPGLWRVTARRVGYRPGTADVRIVPGQVARVMLALEPAPLLLDSLVVQAPALRISTSEVDLGSQLTLAQIALLPTTVDLRQLIALTPGARPDQIWGGASDQANSYSVDGALVNHPGLGGAQVLPSPTWIERLEVKGLGAGAEAGDFQGGLVDVVTLRGRNTLEGAYRTAFESHRLNGSNLEEGEVGSELSGRWEVDGHLRGPILRDRMHFAVFGQVIATGERVLNHLPGATGRFVPVPPRERDARWLGTTSWTAGGRDVVQLSIMGRHLTGDRSGQTGYEAVEATERVRQWNVTGSVRWQRVWSPRSALAIRLSGFVARDRRGPYAGADVPGLELLMAADPPRYQNAPFRVRGAPSSAGLDLTWTGRGRVAGLEHEVRLGGEIRQGGWDFDRTRNGGMTWRPLRVQGFDPGAPATWALDDGIPTVWGGDVHLASSVRSAALFVQEYIQVLPRLRFTPGVRAGWWTGTLTPPGGNRFTAVRAFGVAPRVGLVADLDGRGGVVASAHWGRYYQPMFAGLFDRAAGGAVFTDEETWSWLGSAPATPATTWSREERDALAAAGAFRLEEVVRQDQAGRVEGYRQPSLDQHVVALERALGRRWKAAVVYVHRRNRDHVALVDRNLAANYTVVENVIVLDRYRRPVYFGGRPLVLDRVAISHEDIVRVRELVRQEQVFGGPHELLFPPGLSGVEAIAWDPDYVLSTAPGARRRFRQVQLRLEARYRTWWAAGSATLTSLRGNFNVVTGPDDYTTGGPGPWVRLNEQFNFSGALAHQGQFEARIHAGGLLPAGLRGGVFLSWISGDRVTPTLTISSLTTTFGVATPDTLYLHRLLHGTTAGHRIFVEPRGKYRFEQRASLDLHVERGFRHAGTELVLALDGFNVLGDRSVVAIETAANAPAGLFGSDYGRVRGRVPPRTLRLGAGVRF
jgi:hypothetical protein